jgi:hypothetical protein
VENAPRKAFRNQSVKLTQLRFERPLASFASTDDFSFIAALRTMWDVENIQFSVTILTSDGIPIGNSCGAERFSFRQGESPNIKVVLPSPRLAPGRYQCSVALGWGASAEAWRDCDAVTDTLQFEVASPTFAGTASRGWKRGFGSILFPTLEAGIIEGSETA